MDETYILDNGATEAAMTSRYAVRKYDIQGFGDTIICGNL